MSILVRTLHALADLRSEARRAGAADDVRRISNAIEAMLDLPVVRDEAPTDPVGPEVTETRTMTGLGKVGES